MDLYSYILRMEELLIWLEKKWFNVDSDKFINEYKHAKDYEKKAMLTSLCSIDSGLRAFVCENELMCYLDDNESICTNDCDYNIIQNQEYRLMLSSIQLDKADFLLKNIIIQL